MHFHWRLLHPDINVEDPPEVARKKFQELQSAYEALTKGLGGGGGRWEDAKEWRVAMYRAGDRIALDRTDVAGAARKRPAPPAGGGRAYSRELGWTAARGEYLGRTTTVKSSSVGRGRSKWVKPKEYTPWK